MQKFHETEHLPAPVRTGRAKPIVDPAERIVRTERRFLFQAADGLLHRNGRKVRPARYLSTRRRAPSGSAHIAGFRSESRRPAIRMRSVFLPEHASRHAAGHREQGDRFRCFHSPTPPTNDRRPVRPSDSARRCPAEDRTPQPPPGALPGNSRRPIPCNEFRAGPSRRTASRCDGKNR